MSYDSYIFAMSAWLVRAKILLKRIVREYELQDDDKQEAKGIIKLIQEIIDWKHRR